MEGAELDRDTGSNTNEGSESTLVKGEGTFVTVDGACGVEGGGVLVGCLKADLDDIEGLT